MRICLLLLLSLHAAAQNPGDANSQKARDLVQKAITALGGDAYLNIQDMVQEGRSYSFHAGQPTNLGVVFWRMWKFPDKDRVELTKQRDVIYLYSGEQGYEITYKGTAMLLPQDLQDYLRRRNFSLEWVLRRWTKEPGVAFFYDGTAVCERKMCDQVSLMNSQNEQVTLFIDQHSHLPVKKSYSWRDPRDRERDTEDEIYDNYKLIQGVMTPQSYTRMYNGETASQRFITSVTYNTSLPDTLFQASTTYDPSQIKPLKKK